MIGIVRRKQKWIVAALLLLGMASAAWTQRQPVLAWYYVRSLARADEAGRERWLRRLQSLGEAAAPALLDGLARPDAGACANVRAALLSLAEHWGASDPRTVQLASRLSLEFSRFSPAGRRQVLELAADLFGRVERGLSIEELATAGHRLVMQAADDDDPKLQEAALGLAVAILTRPSEPETSAAIRELTRACLHSQEPRCRVRAVQLALQPDVPMLEEVVPLLNDPAAEVRRAAMLAVGTASTVILEDALLPSLHDPDAEVRQLCEKALIARGSSRENIQLGRLLTDPQPLQRLEVLEPLARRSELDTGLWLRRLSYDPNPAVRVAALRAMSERSPSDFKDRIEEMAQSDPSPTVCDVAQKYLKLSQRRIGERLHR
jgi:hypothetical protein